MALVAPIPSASVTTAVVVTPGAFRSCRNASRKSANTGPSDPVDDIEILSSSTLILILFFHEKVTSPLRADGRKPSANYWRVLLRT